MEQEVNVEAGQVWSLIGTSAGSRDSIVILSVQGGYAIFIDHCGRTGQHSVDYIKKLYMLSCHAPEKPKVAKVHVEVGQYWINADSPDIAHRIDEIVGDTALVTTFYRGSELTGWPYNGQELTGWRSVSLDHIRENWRLPSDMPKPDEPEVKEVGLGQTWEYVGEKCAAWARGDRILIDQVLNRDSKSMSYGGMCTGRTGASNGIVSHGFLMENFRLASDGGAVEKLIEEECKKPVVTRTYIARPPSSDKPFYVFDESMPPRPHYYYLATPYSSHVYAIFVAFTDACEQAALFVKRGIPVFSPIAHSHPVARNGNINHENHDTWLSMDEPLLAASRAVVVCKLPGWERSKGIEREIELAQKYGIPVYYMEPGVIPEIVKREMEIG